jgi:hypothetical protein
MSSKLNNMQTRWWILGWIQGKNSLSVLLYGMEFSYVQVTWRQLLQSSCIDVWRLEHHLVGPQESECWKYLVVVCLGGRDSTTS